MTKTSSFTRVVIWKHLVVDPFKIVVWLQWHMHRCKNATGGYILSVARHTVSLYGTYFVNSIMFPRGRVLVISDDPFKGKQLLLYDL
jgi:hypothetical protein